jgi:glycosyltransferase involved in cell wall biosynthesis
MNLVVVTGNFPRPNNPLPGIWALYQAQALVEAGINVRVVAPAPWLPRRLPLPARLNQWHTLPKQYQIESISVDAPRVPVYVSPSTRRWLYPFAPWLDSSLLWYSLRKRVGDILSDHKTDAILCHHILPWGIVGLRAATEWGIPYIVVEHSLVDLQLARRTRRRETLYCRVLEQARGIVAPSAAVRHALLALPGRVNPDDILVIPHGARPASGASDHLLTSETSRSELTILCVGSFSGHKNQPLLIQAFHQLVQDYPFLRLRLIGDGPNRKIVEASIQALELDHAVTLEGKQPHARVIEAMAACDIFALPSEHEVFGVVYAEAMSLRKPIVLCADAGMAEFVQNGVSAEVITPGSLPELIRALQRLVSSRDYRASIGAAGQAVFENMLTWKHNANRILDVLSGKLSPLSNV